MSFERTHKVKTWESVFLDIRSGAKKAEFRRNDRDYAVGDIVVHHRYWPVDGGAYLNAHGEKTQRTDEADKITTEITHIIKGGFGLQPGFCMFSFAVAVE
jgi:hypothetical protein